MEKRLKNYALQLPVILTGIFLIFIVTDTIGQKEKPKLVVPDTVLRQAALDIMRLEYTVLIQDSVIQELKASIGYTAKVLSETKFRLSEAEFRESVLSGIITTERFRAKIYQQEAQKYKRQATGLKISTGLGVAVVVAALLLKG